MRLIYLLVCLVCLSGCKVKQRLSVDAGSHTEQITRQNIRETEHIQRDSTGRLEVEITKNLEVETEWETTVKTTEYDISKPVIAETGKPPVLREVESVTRMKKKEKGGLSGRQTESGGVSDRADRSKVDSSTVRLSGDVSVNVEQKKVNRMFHIPWLWVIAGAGVVLAGGLYLRGKFKQ